MPEEHDASAEHLAKVLKLRGGGSKKRLNSRRQRAAVAAASRPDNDAARGKGRGIETRSSDRNATRVEELRFAIGSKVEVQKG